MRRRESSDIVLKGKAKFFHKLAMILLYPFRKPAIFIPLLLLMYLVPTFIGARPAEVHLWYWNKIQKVVNSVTSQIEGTAKTLVKPVDGIQIPQMGGIRIPEKGIDQVVDLPASETQNIRRQIFEKSKSAPVAVDIMQENSTVPVIDVEPSNLPVRTPPKTEEVAEKKLPLIYLEKIEVAEGFAKIKNANTLIINNKEIFLYGIYVDPLTTKGIETEMFLKNFINNDSVRCEIKAYTYQKVATAICYVKNQNINRMLVDKDYSKNVALY